MNRNRTNHTAGVKGLTRGLGTCLLAFAVAGGSFANASEPQLSEVVVDRSDLNRDGRVDITDARSLFDALFGGGTVVSLENADLNGDGRTDLTDARLFVEMLVDGSETATLTPLVSSRVPSRSQRRRSRRSHGRSLRFRRPLRERRAARRSRRRGPQPRRPGRPHRRAGFPPAPLQEWWQPTARWVGDALCRRVDADTDRLERRRPGRHHGRSLCVRRSLQPELRCRFRSRRLERRRSGRPHRRPDLHGGAPRALRRLSRP